MCSHYRSWQKHKISNMPEYRIEFHGVAWAEADSEEEARSYFYEDYESTAEYTIDSVEEDN